MTVVRRELPRSRSASRPSVKSGRRIASSRTLQSCLPRLERDATQDRHGLFSSGDLRRHRRTVSHGGPDEADKFSGHRRHGDGRPFAMADEMPIAPVQPLLGAPGVCQELRRLSFTPSRQSASDCGAVAIVPGGFDKCPPHMRVAGLRDGAAALGFARGILAGDQAHVGHQLSRALEALEVGDLGHQDHRRERVDPAEAAKPADRLGVRRPLGERLNLLLPFSLVGERLLEREQRRLEGPLQRGSAKLWARIQRQWR
jgi:hypothetical protein